MKKFYLYILILFVSLNVIAQGDDDDTKSKPRATAALPKKNTAEGNQPDASTPAGKTAKDSRGRVVKAKDNAPELIVDEEEIPDSLLHPRWNIQRTTPITNDDLDRGSADLEEIHKRTKRKI